MVCNKNDKGPSFQAWVYSSQQLIEYHSQVLFQQVINLHNIFDLGLSLISNSKPLQFQLAFYFLPEDNVNFIFIQNKIIKN